MTIAWKIIALLFKIDFRLIKPTSNLIQLTIKYNMEPETSGGGEFSSQSLSHPRDHNVIVP